MHAGCGRAGGDEQDRDDEGELGLPVGCLATGVATELAEVRQPAVGPLDHRWERRRDLSTEALDVARRAGHDATLLAVLPNA